MTNCCCFVSKLLRIYSNNQLDASLANRSDGPVVVQVRNTSERFFYHLLVLLQDAEQTSLTTRQTFRLALYRLFVALVSQSQKTKSVALDFEDLTRKIRQSDQKALTGPKANRVVKRRCEIRALFILSANNDGFVIIRTW